MMTQALPVSLRSSYTDLLKNITKLMEEARRASSQAVNVVMTATNWEIGRCIVTFEQGGKSRAAYGEAVLARLSEDLTRLVGRGFSVDNLQRFRQFFQEYPHERIYATPSRKLNAQISAALSRKSAEQPFTLEYLANRFSLPWSHYVRLMAVKDLDARAFYEAEALRGGWSVRQLDRQINSLFHERALLSRNKAAMLKKGAQAHPEDALSADEEIRDPLVLEFLGLKDEYSESDLEEALIQHLEHFLLELGGDFCFVGRQRRLRIGHTWYRVDLLFFHRRLRCLVVIDLKLGAFTHADAGQMHLYLNYARENWTREEENPPVGLILCADQDEAVAHYALEGLPNKILARQYKLALPKEAELKKELEKARVELGRRG